ncbi:MAG: hypothetical protein RCG16_03600 [Rickettsia hoogstraalii]
MTKHIFIGIDVSEDTLDVWLHPLNKYKVFDNDQKGIKELVEYIADYNIAKIVIEVLVDLNIKQQKPYKNRLFGVSS